MLGYNGIVMKILGLAAGGWLSWFALGLAERLLGFHMETMLGDVYQYAGTPLGGAAIFYLTWALTNNRMVDGFRYGTALLVAFALSLALHGFLISGGVLTGVCGSFTHP